MKHILTRNILFLFLLSFFGSFAQKPAQTIPDFTFYKLDKTPFTNKNVAKGKDVIFIFFDVINNQIHGEAGALP